MGYFGNGFAFTAAPNWDLLASSIRRSVSLRGYRHRSTGLWLLDIWVPSAREHWPFTEEIPSNLFRGQVLSGTTEELLENLSVLATHFQAEEQHSGAELVRNACGISHALSTNVFCFSGDDEGVDVAAHVSPEAVKEFRARFDSCSVEYSGGDIQLIPYQSEEDLEFELEEDPAFEPSTEEFDELSGMRGVTVRPTRTIEGGLPFYGNSASMWPVGDPAALLGLGTWDPFLNLESDYDLEFEVLDSSSAVKPEKPAPKKRWWQF